MTNISYVTGDDSFCIKVDGHAGYAEKGADIVCAAVSALCCTLAARVTETTAEGQYDIYIDKAHGRMMVSACGKSALDAFMTILPGLEQTAYAFPDNVHIAEEVNGGV